MSENPQLLSLGFFEAVSGNLRFIFAASTAAQHDLPPFLPHLRSIGIASACCYEWHFTWILGSNHTKAVHPRPLPVRLLG